MTVPAPTNPRSIEPASCGDSISSFATDIDLRTRTVGSYTPGTAIRRIRINQKGTGSLAVEYITGAQHTINNLADGEVIDAQVQKILATGTNVAKIDVWW